MKRFVVQIAIVAIVVGATVGCAGAQSPPPAAGGWSDADLDRTLVRHVNEQGLVRYDELVRDREPLTRYVERMAAVSPDSHPERFPSRAHELSYWMNAYNALMLDRVARAWPVDSVRNIRMAYGLFWIERHRLGGTRWSLRGLENKIIRARYGDPRIHFAINCASRGCPALPQRAWRPETLERDLDAAARRFVANEQNVRFDADRRVVALSSIFDWFEDDFTSWMAREGIDAPHGLLDYIARYLSAERRAAWGEPGDLRIEFIDYDWSINVAAGGDRGEGDSR